MQKIALQIPYGAVYFRKSNPPREDWERDYAQAAADGYNIFRHWFMWGSIETSPGVYDWEDYDRQLELGEKYGIKTIIAEQTSSVPEWLIAERPELLMRDAHGTTPHSGISGSCVTGGFCGGLCLDHAESRMLASGFLQTLAKRYKGHPSLLGYDIWNECVVSHDMCHCEATAEAYRHWLKEKYENDLSLLSKTWFRYSFTEWSQIKPPPQLQMAPECFDWLQFKNINAYRQQKWRVNVLNEVDSDALKCAHGMALSLENMANGASDDWLAAEQVQVYGLTFVQSRKGAEDWKQFQALDITRSGSRGKPFWHAEAQGGHLWLQPQVYGRSRDDGRISTAQDVRLWNLTSLAGGARGILYPRWRPLLDGALFGAFAPYGMDGRSTARSDMAAKVAHWANAPAQCQLMEAAPVKGEIGIVVVPQAQTLALLLANSVYPSNYKRIMDGAYRSFFDQGIQADFVHIEDIDMYEYLYLPYPVMLTRESASSLREWVCSGGKLVSEGCPAYFGDYGHAATEQPGYGLDEMFGVREEYVEFTPDLLENFSFTYEGMPVWGGEYLQTYRLSGGSAVCHDAQDRIIGARHQYGKGETILLGTCPSRGYIDHIEQSQTSLAVLAATSLGMERNVRMDNPRVRIRLHHSTQGLYSWLINAQKTPQRVRFSLHDRFLAGLPTGMLWAGGTIAMDGTAYLAQVQAQDGVIVRLR